MPERTEVSFPVSLVFYSDGNGAIDLPEPFLKAWLEDDDLINSAIELLVELRNSRPDRLEKFLSTARKP